VKIVGVAGQTSSGLDWISAEREDRDAVPSLLSVPDRAISGLSNITDRTSLVEPSILAGIQHPAVPP
jgi:hypothetical protein